MSRFTEFLEGMLQDGRVVLTGPPSFDRSHIRPAIRVLEKAYAVHRLDVGGPDLKLDPNVALKAARLAHWACWAVVDQGETDRDVMSHVSALGRPGSAEAHLSADLVLRLLPSIHLRARARAVDGILTRSLERAFRVWPLSGTLASIDGPPEPPEPTFGGHPGLALMYASRLAKHPKSGWIPEPSGALGQVVAWSFAEAGVDLRPWLARSAAS